MAGRLIQPLLSQESSSMSTIAAPRGVNPSRPTSAGKSAESALNRILQAVASLKFTCVLFLLAMVIVFIGSLAQARRDVWQVVNDYFRCYVAKVDVQDLFPPSMSGSRGEVVAEWMGSFRYIPFPGGWTIGWLMLANLLCAHFLRFQIRVSRPRIIAGLSLIAAGIGMLSLIVYTGNTQTGVESANTLLSEQQIWWVMLLCLALSGAAGIASAIASSSISRLGRGLLAVVGAALTAVFIYYVVREFNGNSGRLSLSAMRILWQLLKASACSLVLLLGCNLLFEKRGGIALLHFGVALLMFSELQVGLIARENSLALVEGETLDFARDIRERELAIIHKPQTPPNPDEPEKTDSVVVVPEALLVNAAPPDDQTTLQQPNGPVEESQKINLPDLPFDIAVRRFYRNSELRPVNSSDSSVLAEGLGSFAAVESRNPVTGMDEEMDQSSVLVDLIDRESGAVIKSLLLAQSVSELTSSLAEKAEVNNIDYYFYLRFKRSYKPYSVKLLDVSRTNYVGSPTPRDFRSTIEITDDKETRQFTLWMNNPLRYKGETFYQSNYAPLANGQEMSTLSVVRNSGWMLPYLACMIVSFGMFAQFGQTLLRFLGRFERQSRIAPDPTVERDAAVSPALRRPGFAPAAATALPAPAAAPSSLLSIYVPIALTGIFALWILRGVKVPTPDTSSASPTQQADQTGTPAENNAPATAAMNLYEAAKIPMAWNGRTQPLDSIARTMLLMSSHRSTFEAELESWQISQPEVRSALLERIPKVWPSANLEKLKTFEGSYPLWIAAIAEATDAKADDVESTVRDILVVKRAPAAHWLLDLITRPELAARHRVIKIENDLVLAALSLSKRPGLTYSVAEVRENFSQLKSYIEKGEEKQRQKKEYDLTPLERGSLTLFETVSRIDGLGQMFQAQPAENLLDTTLTAWRILQRLQETRAAMAVPTGSKDAQKSWETFVLASTLRDFNNGLTQNNITSPQQLADWVQNQLPLPMVQETIVSTWGILQNMTPDADPTNTVPPDVPTRAGEALTRVRDPYLLRVLALISQAQPGQTAAQVAAAVTPEQAAQIATQRLSQDLFQVIDELQQKSADDPRIDQLRARLAQVGSADEQKLFAAANQEILTIVWNDLHKRVGEVLPGGTANQSFNSAVSFVTDIFNSWRDVDVQKFNSSVAAYHAWLEKTSLPHVNVSTAGLESWFNYFDPFTKASYVYLTLLILVFFSWLFPLGGALRRSALWLLALGFVVHTAALWLRIEISGRPPVTNLYSSAIFIGWAVVIAAFCVELFIRNGIGSLVGGASGAAAIMIAHYLARDEGDTLGVMQAVLDTAFWLATHVVCITIGYAATFVAGFLAVGYCGITTVNNIRRWSALPPLAGKQHEQLGRMVYGVLCFALFFSMVGTVLGGLWADDSWGRFWGWDPKENGAMLIVIWNALILHARWDKMVGDFGTSILAMLGNIVTAWSWFGVNELRAGLHTYGFTEGRLFALAAFIIIQIAVIFVALLLARPPRQTAAA
jgi:ABC-type transport system involved in cytochrome c biogenesis permease subunit